MNENTDSLEEDVKFEITPIDAAAVRAGLEADIAASYKAGFDIAQRDWASAQEYLERRGGLHVDDPFWLTMGSEVDTSDELAVSAYNALARCYQIEWSRLNPLQTAAASHEVESERLEALREQNPGMEVMTEAMLGGPNGEAIIDQFAKSHGHETREDECEVVQNLRAMREHLLTDHADEYPQQDSTPE